MAEDVVSWKKPDRQQRPSCPHVAATWSIDPVVDQDCHPAEDGHCCVGEFGYRVDVYDIVGSIAAE